MSDRLNRIISVGARPSRGRWVFVSSLVAGVVLIVLQFTTFGVTRPLQQFDEPAHVDYVIQLANGSVPLYGTTYRPETKRIAYCVGTPNNPAVDCTSDSGTLDYLWPENYSYESQQAPLGYLAGAAAWRLIAAERTNPADQIAVLRGANLLLALGFALAFAGLAAVTTSRPAVAVAATAFAVSIPPVAGSWSYVTNDAAGPLAGTVAALSAVAVLRARERGWPRFLPWLLVIGVGLLLGLTKLTFAMVPLAFLLYALFVRDRALGSRVAAQLATMGVVGFAYSAVVTRSSPATTSTVFDALLGQSRGDHFPAELVFNSMSGMVGIFLDAERYLAPTRFTPTAYLALALASLGLFAIALMRDPASSAERGVDGSMLGRAAILSVAIAAALWTPFMYLLGGFVWELPSRFLVVMVPVLAIAAMAAFRRLPRMTNVYTGAVVLVLVFFNAVGVARPDTAATLWTAVSGS